ncbi:xanthine dehydrogenase-like [Planoprotostelium fungivorum]|uniref:Xanthine dehydrogenase-like n=1 Tax=Planoprotostelium fungivorum TaxID=1890364 RepID=A0A2P6NRJ9_9EUKA|nr:xanthine dehydrogenase-like [Planoprotostelium fungivorum]
MLRARWALSQFWKVYSSIPFSSDSGSGWISTSGDISQETYKKTLNFYLNGKPVQVDSRNINPAEPLIDYIRNNANLKGTKLACGEGGCGACTVTISHYDHEKQAVTHRAVNSCLVPLCYVEGMDVTTVEGIGSVFDELHPVQERMAIWGGSQCGFCTPGFIMSMYTGLRNNPEPDSKSFQKCMDGNLCRCTGYRPIVDAAKSFCHDTKDTVKPPEDRAFKPYDAAKEKPFPEELKQKKIVPLQLTNESASWYAPTSLKDLLDIKAKIISGSTELGIDFRFKGTTFPVLISPVNVPELTDIHHDDNGLHIGSAVTLDNIGRYLEECAASLSPSQRHRERAIQSVLDQLHYFAGTQIRNVATIGGNIVNASPISDLNPVLLALGATFYTQKAGEKAKPVAASEYFTGYKKVKMEDQEILSHVTIPWNEEDEFVEAYKQGRRREDDIAIVTSAMLAKVQDEKIVKAKLGFGGLAPTSILSPKTEAFLIGKKLDLQTFNEAAAVLNREVGLRGENVPGGQAGYRTTLALSFFYKFFLSLLHHHSLPVPEKLGRSTEKAFPAETTRATQEYRLNKRGTSVGQSEPHLSAKKHTTGEARYVDDMPHQHRELQSALILADRGHAKILSLDKEAAMKVPGVVGIYTYRDVPGSNLWGDVISDEELFASKEVLHYGQMLGIVVAEHEIAAKEAAKLIKIEYEDLPGIYTIDDAIQADSFFPVTHGVTQKNVDEEMSKAPLTLEGQIYMGGQEQFYFETQTSLVVPDEEDMYVYTSTQNAHKTQKFVASTLGIPINQVVTRVGRVGGGFGGKETRNINFSAAAALAAYYTRRPVRVRLERNVDMQITGGRHPFKSSYKIGFDSSGKLLAADLQLYANGGMSHDLSVAVLDRALLFCDSSYNVPALRNKGRVARTNIPSHTAFRGFGGPQGYLTAEAYVEHVASFLKLRPEVVRERNLYNEGDLTYYNFPVTKSVRRSWDECKISSKFQDRLQEIEIYNSQNRHRKRGITLIPSKYGVAFNAMFLNQGSAMIHIYLDGTILVTHGGIEMGQGLNTKVAQVVANELGVHISHVRIKEMATDKIPNASPSAASMSTDIYGGAALDAARQLAERLRPYREKDSGATLGQLAVKAYFDRVSLSAQGFFKSEHEGYDIMTNKGKVWRYFTLGTACTEVEIDTLTGDHKVRRVDLVLDVGDPINPTIDIGQVEGAFMQGAGLVSIEELAWGDNQHPWIKQGGKLQTAGPGTYKIPSADDIPTEWNISLMPDTTDPKLETVAVQSSKAVGEPPLLLGMSVYFAIKEAVKAARREEGQEEYFQLNSPLTSERIRMACVDDLSRMAVGEGAEDIQTKGSF